jgi:outer membrane protein
MRKTTMRRALACLALLLPLTAWAEDLLQVYRDARGYDAQYAAARHTLNAGLEKLPQGRALLLPSLGLTANRTDTDLRQDLRTDPAQRVDREFYAYGYTLTLTQPVFRMQNWYSYDQSQFQVAQAEAVFRQSEQDLIVRATRAYFDVLLAEVTLQQVRANKTAISEQLAQAKRNFEVGTATITDTHEAQARYDLSVAQEIGADNELQNRRRALQQITGKEYAKLKTVSPATKLSDPNPPNMENWVRLAEKQGYPVLIQGATTEIAQLEAKRQSAGHYPTLDLVGTFGESTSTGVSSISSLPGDTRSSTLSLQLALPIYQGGSISSREREAAANHERAKQDLENARRTAALQARVSYLSVISGTAQVRALEQALVSSRSALDSNKLGYEVGVRINIDVLNAQQQVFTTQRDLAQAVYNTIIGHLQLKATAGSLREEDLEEVNRMLVDPVASAPESIGRAPNRQSVK